MGMIETFLIDDNRTQWYPVMERAYEDFFTTGRICCYDFYQMKGMNIAQQGYYGVMNPFFLLSHTVAGLWPVGIDAITLYIGLMVALGSLFFYLLCRRFGCKRPVAFLLTLTYGTMGCFWAFSYWYYVFNNYFLVPLLLYVFLCCMQMGRLSYCACGVVLALSLWMGNVQYTFYHYLLFGVLCLTMILLKNRRYIKVLCANAAVGIALSLPMLLMLMQASGGFQKQEDFMKYPLWYFSLLVHSVIPQGILRRHGMGVSFLDSYVMGRDDNLVCYLGAVGILLFAAAFRAVIRLLRRAGEIGTLRGIGQALRAGYERAAGWTDEKKTIAGCAAALLFFLSLMSGGVVARLLSITPVIKNFRYLFKAVFVVAPLAVLILAYLIGAEDRGRKEDGVEGCRRKEDGAEGCGRKEDGAERRAGRFRSAAVFLLAVYACVGVANACDTVTQVRHLFDMRIKGDFAEEVETARASLAVAGVDGKNYRIAAFLQFPGVSDECFDLPRNLTRNFPTAVGVFSLAGYEMAAEESRLQMFDAVYSDTEFFARFANADTLENFYENLTQEPERVQRQLMDNGVRYLLLDKTTLADNPMVQGREVIPAHKDRRADVAAALQTLPSLTVERVCPFNDHYDLVELMGVASLCMDSAGNPVPLTDENMQTLSFPAQAGQDYTLAFAWDSHLKAFLTKEDGTVRALPVEKTENGDIRIAAGDAGGFVTLTWHDPLCTAGFFCEALTAFALLILLGVAAFFNRRVK